MAPIRHAIGPHVTVFDKSARKDGAFSRDDYTYDHERDVRRLRQKPR
jgi:hypothetical protein